jgi:hypothetical protein
MLNIFGWTGHLHLTDECCVLVGSLGGLNLLPRGRVLRSMEGPVFVRTVWSSVGMGVGLP